jgi:hypothetical protein
MQARQSEIVKLPDLYQDFVDITKVVEEVQQDAVEVLKDKQVNLQTIRTAAQKRCSL